MAHFAIVENSTVLNVVVAEQDWIDQLDPITRESYIQTSFNTRKGVHVLGGTPLRKNYAAIGYTYDRERDAFIPPQPSSTWILDEFTCTWEPPIPCPGDEYAWDEKNQIWYLSQFSME
jgi:hypothetical protein